MDKKTQEAILKWIVANHMHHDYEDVLREGTTDEYDEKWVDCAEAEYPYVNSLELEKFILSLGARS